VPGSRADAPGVSPGDGPVSGGGGVRRRDLAEGVVRLTLERAERRNALNRRMVGELSFHLVEVEGSPEARVVLLDAEGPDFCAGADVTEMVESRERGREAALADAVALADLLASIRRHPRPVVTAVQGRALGGGMGLALAGDLVLAAEGAEFGLPEVGLGFVPAIVMPLLLRRIPETRALDLALTGRRLAPAEAEAWGLVSRTLPLAGFREEAIGFCVALARNPPVAVARTKALLREVEGMPWDAGIRRGAEANAEARFTGAAEVGFQAFLERTRGVGGGSGSSTVHGRVPESSSTDHPSGGPTEENGDTLPEA